MSFNQRQRKSFLSPLFSGFDEKCETKKEPDWEMRVCFVHFLHLAWWFYLSSVFAGRFEKESIFLVVP